jgi:hypothetical protein
MSSLICFTARKFKIDDAERLLMEVIIRIISLQKLFSFSYITINF